MDGLRQNRKLLVRTSDSFNTLAKQLGSSNKERLVALITLLVNEAKAQRIQPGTLLSDLSEILMSGCI
jgi:hypothetical protein